MMVEKIILILLFPLAIGIGAGSLYSSQKFNSLNRIAQKNEKNITNHAIKIDKENALGISLPFLTGLIFFISVIGCHLFFGNDISFDFFKKYWYFQYLKTDGVFIAHFLIIFLLFCSINANDLKTFFERILAILQKWCSWEFIVTFSIFLIILPWLVISKAFFYNESNKKRNKKRNTLLKKITLGKLKKEAIHLRFRFYCWKNKERNKGVTEQLFKMVVKRVKTNYADYALEKIQRIADERRKQKEIEEMQRIADEQRKQEELKRIAERKKQEPAA